jgi:predicted AlkP superfamily phosphohydrolase/phosphomutase
MGKVLILGLDGATWSVLEAWTLVGRMPHLASLMSRGAWGPLRSTVPPLTLPAWSSFSTGKNPGAHGIFAFRRLVTDGYDRGGLANARDLRSATVWDVAGRAGKRVGVVSLPPSYPLRPVNGYVVGCLLTPPGEPFTEPPEIAAELGDYEIDLPAPRGLRRDDTDYLERGLPYLEGLRRQTEQRTSATLRLMSRHPTDLLCVVFYAPDRMQHYFWDDVNDVPGDGDTQHRVRAAVEDVFTAVDAAIGDLVEAVGPEATVILVSDHGFAPKPLRAVHVNRWLADRGLLRPRPFWRLRRRLARKLLPRSARERYDTIDRIVALAKSRAWAETIEPSTAGIWVHACDRYPLGCVASGREYEDVRTEIATGLAALRDEAGELVFRAVHRREDLYRGPHVTAAPDLVAVCAGACGVVYESLRRDLRNDGLFGPFEELGFTGIHDPTGIYLVAGPGVHARGAAPEYPIEAIAPTILHMLGVPIPRDMEAPPCTGLLQEEFLRQHPVRFAEALAEAPPADAGADWRSAGDEALVAERLRSLGYME